MRTRRRRSTATWLPNVGTDVGEFYGLFSSITGVGTVTNIDPGDGFLNIHDVTFDAPVDNEASGLSHTELNRFIGNEYILKRIVGKFFAARPAFSSGTVNSPNIAITAGFFVARADDGDYGVPVGASGAGITNYDPSTAENIREPWIWRRQWVLGPHLGSLANFGGYGPFPSTTAAYGSVADGPHIDSKVKRRVGQDDRLWLAVKGQAWPFGTTDVSSPGVVIQYSVDYRALGTLVKAHNRSAF